MEIGTLTIISNHREIENYNGTWGWGMGSGNSSTTSTTNLLDVINNPSENDIDSHEIRLTGDTGNLSWTLGAYMFEEDSFGSIDVPVLRGYTPPSAADWPMYYLVIPGVLNVAQTVMGTKMFGSRSQSNDVTNSNEAFYAEGTYAFNDQTDLTIGMRRTEDEREYLRIQSLIGGGFDPAYACPGNIDATTGVAKSDRCYQEIDYSETTSRAILSHAYNEDFLVYASYSKGYSSGGFNQDVRMKPFLPEVSDNYEVGFKSTLRDGTVRLNATYFSTIYKNQQITVGRVIDGQPTADIVNANEADLSGLEFELAAQLTDNLALTMTYGLLDGEYNDFNVVDTLYDPATFVSTDVLRDLICNTFWRLRR
jgi:iron complex outermembrane receptor protein